jgi:sugar phosphate isomerase/epimerase
MARFTRRVFLETAGAAAAVAGLGAWSATAAAESPKRKFTMDLVCGAIGVRADQREAVDLAHEHGFESVAPDPGFLGRLSDAQLEELLAKMKEKNLVWGAAGLPVNFRADEAAFTEGLKRLPEMAKALQRAGAGRVGTWLAPCHPARTYLVNFRLHAVRLREIAKILGDCGQRLGLEYVGPKTSWTAARYPFIHTMLEMKELIVEIGRDNVGLVLDSWHWYTAGETEAELLTLSGNDVVACDLNDAPAGVPVDQQRDGSRELPAATGVIDLKTFLGALVTIGYDGPVRAEPFNKALRDMPDDEAMAATAAAMKKAFALLE